MNISKEWMDYELIDASDGEKLERWNDIILIRPDPQIVWTSKKESKYWSNYHAYYHRNQKGGGFWEYKKPPRNWDIKYKDLTFNIKLMNFKHTGVFPEQAFNWDYMINKISNRKNVRVLNLFAYTGCASVACLYAGADVVHVDSSKGMIDVAKENVLSSNLGDRKIRYIVDDVVKFVEREIRRGNKYDCIIMDPPSYGRGVNGEVWNIETDLYRLIMLCSKLLSDNPLFFLINSYTTGLSPIVLENILKLCINKDGLVNSGEVGLPITGSDLILPCGIYGRWESK